MKILSLIITLLFYALNTSAQNPKSFIVKAYIKCQSVKNGYYEMTNYNKYMSGIDTNITKFNCYFKKLEMDSLYPSAFHYKLLKDDLLEDEIMYTGNEFVTIYNKDSNTEIMSKSKWAAEIQGYKNNYTFYTPLTTYSIFPGINFLSSKQKFIYIGEEKVNGLKCSHIQVLKQPANDSTDPIKDIRIDYHYWINNIDSIPIQYSFAVDEVMGIDTMYQYEKFVLNKYEINNLKDESILTLKSIPPNYKLTDFVPYKRQEPLPVDAVAPAWSLKSITGEKVNLRDFKGKIVLIDFFYKSCYPCMLALPALQALQEKYKDKGLQVIGINPFDKLEDSIVLFLKKRGITYPVLLDEGNTEKDYHVSGYPMMYIIDKNGKIIFSQSGYGEEVDGTLEGVIKKYLLLDSQKTDSVKINTDTIAKKQLWVTSYTGVRGRGPVTLYLYSDSTYSLYESDHTGYHFEETGKYSLKKSNIRFRSIYYISGYGENAKKHFKYKSKTYQMKDDIIFLYDKNKKKELDEWNKVELRKTDWYKTDKK